MRLGIDIGTHTAQAAYLDNQGQPQLLYLPNGSSSLPAMARQTMHGLVIGPAAAQSLAGNAETTLCGCVRLMGQAGDISPNLLARLPYAVRQVDGEALCNLLYAEVRASDVYGHLVRTLVDGARQSLGQPIDEVVLTVPASAEDRFRVQARAAVEKQGIRVGRLINQPTAALLATSLPPTDKYVAVLHCGGGSTDVSVAQRSDNHIQILATAGDMQLGGDDFAWAVAEQLNKRFQRTAAINIFEADRSRIASFGLQNAAKNALHTLSLAPQMTLTLDHGGGFGRDLVTIMHRQDIEQWLAPMLKQIAKLCQQVLSASGLKARQINRVVLTGEWSYLPAIQETVAKAFAKQVGQLHTKKAALLPVYGAALASANNGASVWDVTPYPLGINCYYGEVELFSPIIAANTPIPTPPTGDHKAYTEHYTTRFPNQKEVKLDILQYRGLRNPSPTSKNPVYPHECELLGTWRFTGLRPKRGQTAPFSVTFAVDEDGILHLYAKETATGHCLEAAVRRGIG